MKEVRRNPPVSLLSFTSNAVEGYLTDSGDVYPEPDPNLPECSILNIRFSLATLIFIVSLLVVMAIVLVVLSFRKLPGYMPIVGTNSRLIAAACHISPLSNPHEKPRESNTAAITCPAGADIPLMGMGTGGSAGKFATDQREEGYGNDEAEYYSLDPDTVRLTKISRGLLSWGVVRMPDEWYASFSDTIPESDGGADPGSVSRGYELAHMSFGTPSDNVRPPKDGTWYVFR